MSCVNRKSIQKDCLKESTKLFKSVLLNSRICTVHLIWHCLLSPFNFDVQNIHITRPERLGFSAHFMDNGNNWLAYLWQVPISFSNVFSASVHVRVTIGWLDEIRYRIFPHFRWHLQFYLCKPLWCSVIFMRNISIKEEEKKNTK